MPAGTTPVTVLVGDVSVLACEVPSPVAKFLVALLKGDDDGEITEEDEYLWRLQWGAPY